ncbi:LiaF domain-containing protein [Alteromonas gilva]|uniref:LiaF-related protein n=1 Tax=Alteromonas gilva TaxID=2987522 RepID=A0ABT5L7N7_9ALTE|nr:LiaF domain-containing protein [Alteromonas gilva]MDC8832511.1 LiaF-related protein [Alteromonas gilva]
MVTLEDRPIEQVREEVIDKLIYHYSHGVISAEAFERRLDAAMLSQDHHEIAGLAADLTMDVDDSYTRQKEKKLNINYAAGDVPPNETMINVMGGSDRSGRWKVPAEIRLLNFMGGSDIDFSDAVFTTPNVTIKTICIMGRTNIKVPENINVVTKAFCFMGGIDNKAPSIADRQAPTVTVEGFVLMGGIDIDLKRTIKEKFVALANQMKAMFSATPHR